MDTPKQILKRTKVVLKERGWYQGGMEKSVDGPCCLLMALQIAAGMQIDDHVDPSTTNGKVYTAIIKATGATRGKLGEWNDQVAGTVDDVFSALDAAIFAVA